MPIRKDALRPTRLAGYLGQPQIKEVLETSILAAKERKEPLDHVLLNGPPGLGKTTLANIIANEMDWKIQAVIAPSLTAPIKAQNLLAITKPKTILFIDEVHRLRRTVQEFFYPVLEDGQMQISGAALDLPQITIIGATTAMGRLDQPFIDRFPLKFELEYYKGDVLDAIAEANVQKLKFGLDKEAITAVADRSRGTPRVLNNLLRRLRDFAQINRVAEGDADFVESVMWGKLGIDGLGLDKTDRKYLEVLEDAPYGIGLDAIAKEIAQSVETVEDYIEPFLIRLGFIERRSNGRWITNRGKDHLKGVRKSA